MEETFSPLIIKEAVLASNNNPTSHHYQREWTRKKYDKRRYLEIHRGRRKVAKPLKIIRQRETPKGLVTQAAEVVDNAKIWFQKQRDLLAERHILMEGPMSLRAISFLFGNAMSIASFIGLCHGELLLESPPSYILQLYLLMFGLTIMIVEAKNLSFLETWRNWVDTWFPFLLVALGKAGLHIFMGCLGLSLWRINASLSIIGGCLVFLGFIYVAVHFGLKKELRSVGLELTQPGRHEKMESQHNSDAEFSYPIEYIKGMEQALHGRFYNQKAEDDMPMRCHLSPQSFIRR